MTDLIDAIEPSTHTALTIARDRISVADAIELWLAKYQSINTRRAYRREIERFAEFLGLPTPDAAQNFISATDYQAHSLVDAYKARMIQRECSPATINRAMAALNSFVKSARRHGLSDLRLEAEAVASEKYRDTRGPGTAGVKLLIAQARAQRNAWKASRDEAIIRLLFSLGLRRAELVHCDLKHLNVGSSSIAIKGKGKTELIHMSVPPVALAALVAWIAHRGPEDGPLFPNMDAKQRMTGAGIYALVGTLGARAGITAKPHGIRHAAITAILDATNGDMRKAQAFGRHASASTTVAYDDNRQDLGGSAARLLDALVE